MSDQLLEAALAYAASGRPVAPVKLDKKPYTDHGYKDATLDEATIRAWWAKWPDAGIATPTGPNWFVLDDDDPAALAQLEAEHGPLPPTIEVATPRPGRHLYFRTDVEVSNSPGALPKGIEVRGTGTGYVLLPPSPHPNGTYEWKTAPDEVPMAPAPAWLIALLKPPNMNGHAPPVEGDIPKGQINTTLASMAGTMRRRGFHEPAIAAALLVTNRDRCKPPLQETEVRKIARSVARYKPAEDAAATFDDLTALLGLDAVGKRIDAVRVYGRGSNAQAHVLLDDGGRIALDPLGRFTTVGKLTAELALQAGAAPALKATDVTKVLVLFHQLADHYAGVELDERAWEYGAEYLRDAAIAEVVMSDQASRWRAFVALNQRNAQNIVLTDPGTGIRYVRIGWYATFVRVNAGPGIPDAVVRAMPALGWAKQGSEGRIKATAPDRRAALQFKFFCVPPEWEER